MSISNPRVTVIAAISQNRGLGKNNQLLWKIPQDLNFFKTVTSGSPIIMGNKTYYSIGRPLPNRLNIVVSRTLVQQNIKIDGCEIVSSIKEAIALATSYLNLHEPIYTVSSEPKELKQSPVEPEIFIIGGAQMYAHALKSNIVDRVLLTEIHQTSDADVFFPVLEKNQWQEVWRESHFDEQNGFSFDFVDYRKLAQ